MTGFRIAAVLAAITVAGFGVLRPITTTHADSGTISTSNTSLSYTHGPFYVPNPNNLQGVSCGAAAPCDDYTLNVNVPAGTDTTQQINVQIAWPLATADFDLYILDSSGAVLASSATSNDPEKTSFAAVSGAYTIRVVPYNPLGQSFTASANIGPKPAPAPSASDVAPAYTGIAPRFQNYAIPSTQGGQGGEPSIGANWDTGNVLYQASLTTFKVAFNDATSPAKATWTDVSAANTSKTSLDPILFTDHLTDRTFVSQLTGADSLSSFTDNDGHAWTPSQGGGLPSGVDHQTIGGGPYSTQGGITPPNTGAATGYKDAVYYCSQSIASAFCARSDDGGLTFGAGVPIYSINACTGMHGHVKVAPNDGTVYVPNRSCGGHQAVVVSTDNGLTWSIRPIPDSTSAIGSDPSVGIASDGTLYFGYQASDGHARIAVSHDQGKTWSKSLDVGAQAGVQNSVFPAVVAGDANRASFAYIGTTTGGNYQATGSFPGVWYLYISTTYDGGQTWSTVDVTPTDPVQRGSICTGGTLCGTDRNLLDFMDITTDAQGRVLVGYPDGCTGACVTADPTLPASQTNSYSALASIARQSGGKSLFATYDTPQPAAPARPGLTATRTQVDGPVTLSWQAPDDGGSAITGYRLYRGTTPGGETLYRSLSVKTSYIDNHVKAGVTYYYTLQAVNGYGTSPASPEVSPVLIQAKPMCTLPGQLVLTDPTGDQLGAPNNSALDIQSVSVAEPASLLGTNNLVFTMKVADLSNPGTEHQWRVFWNIPDGTGNRYYVGMNVDATGAVSYVYGTIKGDLPDGTPAIPLTTNQAIGGGFNTDGTITVIVPKSGVGSPAPGSSLKSLQGRTFIAQGNVTVFGTAAAADVTGYNDYAVQGNAYCQ